MQIKLYKINQIKDHAKQLFLVLLIQENQLYLEIYINNYTIKIIQTINLMLAYLTIQNMNNKVEKLHKYVTIKLKQKTSNLFYKIAQAILIFMN